MSFTQHAWIITAGLVGALALTGCSSQQELAEDPGPRAAQVVWETEAVPVTPVTEIGGTAVFYASKDRRLTLFGLDPASGKQRWHEAASPSETDLNSGIFVDGVRDSDDKEYVAFLRPSDQGVLYASLVVLDPVTGEQVHETEPKLFRSVPSECSEGHDICVSLRDDYDEDDYTPHRFSLESGKLIPDRRIPEGSWPISDDGLIAYDGGAMVAYSDEDGVRWRLRVDKAFGGGVSAGLGGNAEIREDDGAVIASLGSGHTQRGRVNRWDLTRWFTARLALMNGKVLWNEKGTYAHCNGRLYAAPKDEDGDGGQEVEAYPVRCRYDGRAEYANGKAKYDALKVTIEGYDLETGETTWDVPVGAAGEFVFDDYERRVIGASSHLVPTENGPLVVDLATGDTRAPTTTDVFMCYRQTDYTYREGYYIDGKPKYKREGGMLLRLCDSSGKPLASPPLTDVLETVSDDFDGYRIIATAGGVTGYRVV